MSPSTLIIATMPCLLVLAQVTGASDLPTYTVTNLGTLNSFHSDACDISDNGQVVGVSKSKAGVDQAFVWDPVNGMRDIGNLGGKGCRALAVNVGGQAIGRGLAPEGVLRPFIWEEANGIQLLSVPAGSAGGNATDINGVGQVVGRNEGVAFVWDITTGATTLPTLGGKESAAESININGQVVGCSYLASGMLRAFLWDPSSGLTNLGTLGGSQSQAYGINDAGHVVGYSHNAQSVSRAFLWNSADGMQDLGALQDGSSWALDINNDGQVVGYAYDKSVPRATYWDAENGMIDLNALIPADSGWVLNTARAINSEGAIVGYGTLQGESGQRAFLLLPELDEPASITYDGDTLLSTEGSSSAEAALVAAFRDEEGAVLPLDGVEVVFDLTALGLEPLQFVSNSIEGVAEYTASLEPAIYSVTVWCTACELSASAVIEVRNPLCGSFVTGGGWILLDNGTQKCQGGKPYNPRPVPPPVKASFNLNVMYHRGICRGVFQCGVTDWSLGLQSFYIDRLIITRDKVAQFRGWAFVNGKNKCWFSVTAWDNGQPGRKVDAIELRVWNPGAVAGDAPSRVISGVLDGGNIHIQKNWGWPPKP